MRLAAPIRVRRHSSLLLPWTAALVVLLSTASIFSATALAQNKPDNAIVGRVADETGNGIPGASITITGLKTGVNRNTKTDRAGRYSVPGLKPDIYSVKVEAQGFHPNQKDDNSVSGPDQTITVNFTVRGGGFF